MLECVINISEGQHTDVLEKLRHSCVDALLDVHSDAFHNRSVFTLAGPNVELAARRLAEATFETLDIREHHGVHPRIGVVDVVPFVPLQGSTLTDAQRARNEFAEWAATTFNTPTFLYGSERTLPDVRKNAFKSLRPDFGPPQPNQKHGAIAVGARDVLVAYNLWLKDSTVETARQIANEIRQAGLRTLGLAVGGAAQVSCNLTNPLTIGPQIAYDLVAERAEIERAELVGLLPEAVLQLQENERWPQLDIGPDKTIESRLSRMPI